MKGLLFTYLLTYGGAFASLLNPFVGLLIYIIFAIIKPEALWFWSVPAGNYSRIIALALLAGWALHGFGNWNLGRAKAIALSLILFLVWAGVSLVSAQNPDVVIGFLESKGKIVLPVIVGLTLIDSTRKLKALAWTLALSLGYVAYDLNMSYFDGFNRLHEFGFGGMDNNSQSIALVSGVGLAFFLGLYEPNWPRKLLAFACAAFMTHAVMFSFSRGAMVSLLAVGAVTFLIIPKQPKHYLLFALGVLLAVRMAGPQVVERFATTFAQEEERDGSAQSRLDMWKICIEMMAQNPLTGVGADHFPIHAHEYGLTRGKEAHSLWLQTGAEMGVPGMTFLFAFYALTMWRLWKTAWRRAAFAGEDPFFQQVARMVIASLTGFMLAAQFVSLEGLEFPYYVALLGAGALKVYSVPLYAFGHQFAPPPHWPAFAPAGSMHPPPHA